MNTALRTVGVARLGEVGRLAGPACGLGRARSDLTLCSSSRDELGAQRRADFFQQQLEQAVFVLSKTIQSHVNSKLIGEQISFCRAQPLSHCCNHLLKRSDVLGFHFGMSRACDHPVRILLHPNDNVSVLYVTQRTRA